MVPVQPKALLVIRGDALLFERKRLYTIRPACENDAILGRYRTGSRSDAFKNTTDSACLDCSVLLSPQHPAHALTCYTTAGEPRSPLRHSPDRRRESGRRTRTSTRGSRALTIFALPHSFACLLDVVVDLLQLGQAGRRRCNHGVAIALRASRDRATVVAGDT